MPEPQERHYNINKLNLLFAVASITLLGCLVWMFQNDFDREWKGYQARFRDLEIEKTRVAYDLETHRVEAQADYQTLESDLKTAQINFQAQCSKFDDVKKEISAKETEHQILDQRYRVTKAELDAAKFDYEDAIGKGKSDVSKVQKHYELLQGQIGELKKFLDANQEILTAKQGIVDDCASQLKALERKEHEFSRQSDVLLRKLKKIDPNEMDFTNQIGGLVRDLPVIDFANPKYKIEQVVLKDITEDVNYMQVPRVDRCTTCHLGIANPEYKDASQPFTTHPNLELFLAKDSAHPLEEFGCTVCHGGRGRGTDFVSAVHTPSSEEQKKEWEAKYHWHEIHHWEQPMLAKPFVQAGCFKCHSDASTIKGAEKLNLGLKLIEKSGCYACHLIDKYKDWPKPGPDLTHLAAKTTKQWAYHWIEDPKSFRHNTWMPSFFNQSNTSDEHSKIRGEQEIHAIVQYLFSQSEPFALDKIPQVGNPPNPLGNPEKGKEIVSSVGCFACHQIEPQPSDTKRDRQSLLREQGPNLIGLGSKTSVEWVYQWLKDPNRYHPETKMPNLRLSDQEAADAAAFLVQDNNLSFNKNPVPPVDEKIVDEITKGFLSKIMTQSQVSAKLAQMPLEEKLSFSGQKLIAQYGCYSCHNIKGFENYKPIGTELTEEGSKAADRLDFGFIDIEHNKQEWFAQKLKDPRIFDHSKIKAPDEKLRMPNFQFKDEEIEAIVTAILGFVKDKPASTILPQQTPEHRYVMEGEAIIRQFNCQGCHIIEGEGGAIRPEVAKWLQDYQGRSETEANAMVASFSPPNLAGEGKKVQAQWLFGFLHQPTTIRPWLKTRMPTYHFNANHLNALVKYFSALDKEEFPFADQVEPQASGEEYEEGKKLFSQDYFSCGSCHIIGEKMPSGTPEKWAPDFALAFKRLKPEWIKQWIKNPQALSPGTKMPTFFDPESFDAAGPEDVLNGDENLQIKALRDYILTLSNNQSAPKPAPAPASAAPQPPATSQ